MSPLALPQSPDQLDEQREKLEALLKRWLAYPPLFVVEAIGATPDPWQCDVLDALYDAEDDNVALRACHGVGKTATMAWAILHYTMLHRGAIVPTTAPTFNKQVRDVLWGTGVHVWYMEMRRRALGAWLANQFELTTVRLAAKESPATWFAVGIASSKPINMEGYHGPHVLAVFDEAKGIQKATWDAVQGMRTTQRAKLFVGSTPGGPAGEFFKVFTQYRSTWKRLFVIHPLALKGLLRRPEAIGTDPDTGKDVKGAYAKSGTYYSDRVTKAWIQAREREWGQKSPVFIARAIGDFPEMLEDVLVQFSWFTLAESKEDGAQGDETWVAVDVARYGQDRTVGLVGRGATLLHGETIARTPTESTAPEAHAPGAIGDDPKRPLYRSIPVTADFAARLRSQHGARGIIIDDTGLGGGVTDELKKRGEVVIPINFGSAPTDKPKTPDALKYKRMRGLPETHYFNLKAQMGWALRLVFEAGLIGLGRLPEEILEPLRAQCTLAKTENLPDGRIKLLDPDQSGVADDWAQLLDETERRRSPDHLHALMLYWWAAGTGVRMLAPAAQAILNSGTSKIAGRRPDSLAKRGAPIGRQLARGVAGQAAYLGGLYRGRPGR